MALVLEQKPLYNFLPVGQPIIYSIFDSAVIGGSNHKIKYIAEVYVDDYAGSIMVAANRVAILKSTPNEAGYGMFDFSAILDSYVSPDYEGGVVSANNPSSFSQYKLTDFSDKTPHTIHQIDRFSTNRNSCKYASIKFKIEYATTSTGTVSEAGYDVDSDKFIFFNGVLYDNDTMFQNTTSGNFGYTLYQHGFFANNTGTQGCFTNAPQKQYIRDNDYATLAFANQISFSESGEYPVAASGTVNSIHSVLFTYYDSSGSSLGTTTISNASANGGYRSPYLTYSNTKIGFIGVGTANLQNHGVTIPAGWAYYTVELRDDTPNVISTAYEFHKQDTVNGNVDCKGYETIRLTWLNKWGFWDYYNFDKKSTRTFSTERKTYTQVTGTWSSSRYNISDHTGGVKNYSGSVKENITLNTNHITDETAEWLEELFVSNDVYILAQDSTDGQIGYVRKYITPCRIVTDELLRKTKVNDKLVSITFDIETNRTKKSQKI